MTIIWSKRFRDHATGSHPERPERIDALEQGLDEAGIFSGQRIVEPEPVEVDDILRVHRPELVELIRQMAESGGGWLDPDTYVSPDSYEVALLAAGAASMAVETALTGDPAFALPRPPGHHAEPGRAMGFCLFNSVAVAVERARHEHGIGRVAIIDWDVHHGNGTQAAYWSDPDTLFVSLHQYPFYPGTGAEQERGGDGAEGATLNIPLPAGAGDELYLKAFEERVIPAVAAFAPELIVVSAGFDAHADDPLAGMRVTTGCFRSMAASVAQLALDTCQGRLALVLEGGYDLHALAASTVATIEEVCRTYENRDRQ